MEKNKYYIRIRNTRFVRKAIHATRKIILPGFDGLPLYDVLVFFVKGLIDGAVTTRASSVAFKFFIALFPAIIFMFTLIPYIPVHDFQATLLGTISGAIPENFYAIVESTIEDIIMRQHSGALSIGFVLTLYFASNGILGMITAFNSTTHSIETRGIVKQYMISIVLVLILFMIVLISVASIIGGTAILDYLREQGIFTNTLVYFLIKFTKWIVVVLMLFFAVSFIYYLAPARRAHFRFISAGSTLATLLFLLTTLGFNFYVNQFANYNVLYGSIGTLIVIMMWFYFNSLVLIVGFELNASIAGARHHKDRVLDVLKDPTV